MAGHEWKFSVGERVVVSKNAPLMGGEERAARLSTDGMELLECLEEWAKRPKEEREAYERMIRESGGRV